MSTAQLTREQLAELAKYDTPTVCNAIELFAVRPRTAGCMDRRIQACFPAIAPMVGYAATATFRAAAPSKISIYDGLFRQLDTFASAPSPVVVFQDLDNPSVAATFGKVMCTTYQRFGAVGLITSGTGRDLDQVAKLNFPVFTNGAVCSHGYCHIPSVQAPVNVGGVTVHPGDLLHGDLNGVTTIPAEIASEVADICAGFAESESHLFDYLNAGSVTQAGLKEAQAAARDVVERLKSQVERRGA